MSEHVKALFDAAKKTSEWRARCQGMVLHHEPTGIEVDFSNPRARVTLCEDGGTVTLGLLNSWLLFLGLTPVAERQEREMREGSIRAERRAAEELTRILRGETA